MVLRRGSPQTGSNSFVLAHGEGAILARYLSPEGFASGLRQPVEHAKTVAELDTQLWGMLARLKVDRPDLKTPKGEHYTDVLGRLIDRRIAVLATARAEEVPAGASVAYWRGPGYQQGPPQHRRRRAYP